MTRKNSFRSLAIAACGASLGLIGCQRVANAPPLSLSPSTMDVDEAMQVRDWDKVNALYANGTTIAGPIDQVYTVREDQAGYRYALLETPVFLGNIALLPYVFYKTPVNAPVAWKGDSIEPTYTACPPLPPE